MSIHPISWDSPHTKQSKSCLLLWWWWHQALSHGSITPNLVGLTHSFCYYPVSHTNRANLACGGSIKPYLTGAFKPYLVGATTANFTKCTMFHVCGNIQALSHRSKPNLVGLTRKQSSCLWWEHQALSHGSITPCGTHIIIISSSCGSIQALSHGSITP